MRLTLHTNLSALIVVSALGLSGGCKHVRDFLIPPQSNVNVRGHADRNAVWADMVLRNVRTAEADDVMVAIGQGRVLAIGSEAEVGKFIGPGTPLRDVRKGFLSPGFVDAHVHLDGMALAFDGINLSKAKTVEDVQAVLLPASELVGNGGWMWAYGASHALLAKLSATTLDNVKPDIAVWVSGQDGHAAVISRGLADMLPASAGPLIAGKQGRLDAITSGAVWRLLPLPSLARTRPLILRALAAMAHNGYTTVHTMGATLAFLHVLIDLERSGRLQTRVFVYLDAAGKSVDRYLLERAARLRPTKPGQKPRQNVALPDDETRKVRVVGVKMWLDGSLGARTAALSANYADAPTKGALRYDDDAVGSLLERTDAAGLQLALHAIGDAAVAQVVRVLQSARRPKGALPVRIEHAQVVSPAAVAALVKHRVVCVIQPLHRLDDVNFATERLGKERIAWAYRVGSLAKVCPVATSSDAPISKASPWKIWQQLVSGLAASDTPGEAMSAAAALQAMSVDPLTGGTLSIKAGAVADFVLWSAQPAVGKPPPTRLLMVVDGEIIFADPGLPKPRIAPSLPR